MLKLTQYDIVEYFNEIKKYSNKNFDDIDMDTIVVVSITSNDISGYVNIGYRTKDYQIQKTGVIQLKHFINQIRDYKIQQIIE